MKFLYRTIFLFLISAFAHADLPVIDPTALIQLQKQVEHLGSLKDFSSRSLQELESQSKALTGNYGIGQNYYDRDLPSWGTGSNTLQDSLNIYQSSHAGKLSSTAKEFNREFPIQPKTVANPNPRSMNGKHYELQAKTALLLRSASLTIYDNLQKQFDLMNQLQGRIDQTQNLKEAVDLNNRLLLENNLLQLQLLRLAALTAQQQAINAQGEVNAIVNQFNTAK